MNTIPKTTHIDTQFPIVAAVSLQTKKDHIPKFSVIISVYNTEDYLSECLSSVVSQTLKEIEIICVNDGSTDASLEILQSYQQDDARIIIINQENQGLARSRNNAFAIAKGEYISFVDADDWIRNDALEILYRHSIKYNADMTMFGGIDYNNTTKDFEINNYYSFQYLPDNWDKETFDYHDCNDFITQMAVSSYLTVYKNKFLHENKISWINRKIVYEDNLFFAEALFKAKTMTFIKDTLYFRRIHSESITQNNRKHFKDFLIISKLLIDFLSELNLSKSILNQYENTYSNLLFERYLDLGTYEKIKYLYNFKNTYNSISIKKISYMRIMKKHIVRPAIKNISTLISKT